MTRGDRAAFALVAGIFVGTFGNAEQVGRGEPAQARSTTTLATTGTGVVEGRVMLTGRPAPRPAGHARVTVRGTSASIGGSTVADAEGRFTVARLPAGTFTVTASRPGFVDTAFGATRPGGPGARLVLGEAQRLSDLVIELPPAGAIAGVLTDGRGRVAQAVWVRAFQYQFRQGERTLASAGGATRTDSRGQFRLAGLTPGDYVVVATGPARDALGAAARVMTPEASEFAAAAFAAPAGEVRLPDLPPAGAPGSMVTYAGTFFPGTTIADDARRIAVRSGETQDDVSFAVQPVRATSLAGMVARADGQPLTGIEVAVAQLGLRVPSGPPVRRTTLQPSGAFSVAALPPGRYRVTARTAMPRAQGRGTPPSAIEPTLWATADLDLRGEDLRQVDLTLQLGAEVEGRIIVASEGTVAASVTGLRVQLLPADGQTEGSITGDNLATLEGDAFRIASVRPGAYYFSVRWAPGSAGPDVGRTGQSVVDVVQRGASLLDRRIDLASGERLRDVEVMLTGSASGVAGAILDDGASRPVPHHVVLFPRDPAQWFPQSSRIRSVRLDSAGQFNLPARPGAYYVAAVVDLEDGQWLDPDVLRQLARAAVEIDVEAGRVANVTLRVNR